MNSFVALSRSFWFDCWILFSHNWWRGQQLNYSSNFNIICTWSILAEKYLPYHSFTFPVFISLFLFGKCSRMLFMASFSKGQTSLRSVCRTSIVGFSHLYLGHQVMMKWSPTRLACFHFLMLHLVCSLFLPRQMWRSESAFTIWMLISGQILKEISCIANIGHNVLLSMACKKPPQKTAFLVSSDKTKKQIWWWYCSICSTRSRTSVIM